MSVDDWLSEENLNMTFRDKAAAAPAAEPAPAAAPAAAPEAVAVAVSGANEMKIVINGRLRRNETKRILLDVKNETIDEIKKMVSGPTNSAINVLLEFALAELKKQNGIRVVNI